jgi:hypothetical protein
MKWEDIPSIYRRPMFLLVTKESLLWVELRLLPVVLKEVDSMQVPWRDDADIVGDLFLNVIRRLSQKNERYQLAGDESSMNEINQVLDFCMSKIDHSMLSSIITK